MQWRDMSISKKFVVNFGIILFFISLISLTGIVTIKLTEDNITKLETVHDLTVKMLKKEVSLLDWANTLKGAIDEGNVDKLQTIELDHKNCTMGKWYFSGGRENIASILPNAGSLLNEFEQAHKELHDSAVSIKEVLKKGDKGAVNEAYRIYKTKTLSNLAAVRDSITNMNTMLKDVGSNTDAMIKTDMLRVKIVDATIVILFILVFVVMSIKITRHITSNITRAVNVAERLAEGDVSSIDIRLTHKDETGMLLLSMQKIVESMSRIAKAAERVSQGDLTVEITPQSDNDILCKSLAMMTKNLRQQTQEILDAANVLASSISQIMTSATEIAASASETATSVSETTVTADEVRQTANLSASKAANVTEVIKNAIEASQVAYVSVDETIENMDIIRKQMDSIAESIVRLSEQGQVIGEIVNTVSDLAEQSNLLAVNASIEAARAGEYGRGFTVVAQEVRALAEQSKAATTQIKSILTDIQNATSRAVLVTEQGGKAVAEGMRQSTDTGLRIKELANKISVVADAGSQIVASSQQQVAGMNQIVFAMENINQASAQNAENIRAFESVTHSLNETAQRLKAVTSRYRV